ALLLSLPLVLLSVGAARILEDERRFGRIIVAVGGACAAAALGYGVTFGRHFQSIAVRMGFIVGIVMVSIAVCWWLLPSVIRIRSRSPRVFVLAALIGSVGIELANFLVLPRLYPVFHTALTALAVMMVALAGTVLAGSLSTRRSLVAASCLVILAAAITPFSRSALLSWDNVRLLYVNHAPTFAQVLSVMAASGAAEPSIDEVDIVEQRAERWEDWHERDVLLLTVDALRADRLGVYGYERRTSPRIDALAASGIVFERAYTVMPHTSYAMTSLLTGKYIRPLLIRGTGQDSDTLAAVLRTYGYRTAAFYPPSLFAVDEERFAWAKASGLDFEYRKLEYAEAGLRRDQVMAYLDFEVGDHRFFVWAHFFEPHEPYAPPEGFDFGPRATDRYDGEIAAVDAVIGQLVQAVWERRPDTVVVITADHGEAFGEHGAYYHGTTVYEEQVRVPLIVLAKGLQARRVSVPVQLIDVMPTILHAMGIPVRPRVRGIDLGGWMSGNGQGDGFAFSETHDQVLLAEGKWRLVCERRVDACSLFDLSVDSQQLHDCSAQESEVFIRLRQRLRAFESSHGAYERTASRAEGKDLPEALVRGMAGDAEAAEEVAGLLEDADVVLRRKAAEVLFQLARKESAPSLSLAISRDEDGEVRQWCALALTRLGHGAPLTLELLRGGDEKWRRLAALVLAESGEPQGAGVLLAWWETQDPSIEQRKQIAHALGKIGWKAAVVPLCKWLDHEQLRPILAEALARLHDPYAKIVLLRYFSQERYLHTRLILARSLVALGASREMAPALMRFLGVADPLEGGVGIAREAKILDALGGPNEKSLAEISKAGSEGVDVSVIVPKGGNGKGYRAIVRVRSKQAGRVQLSRGDRGGRSSTMASNSAVVFDVPAGLSEVHAELGDAFGAMGSGPLHVVLVPSPSVQVEGFVIVPLADEIPP
ncbi:MAG TPA: sulfatase-like hydrolase/transferase, partial [Polyangiaceae bacterium]|nr:sulfatase-like hydrolase/transferase [Polyangiaceae bacterium]